ncbi:hypothetical protein WMY93_033503, partial [Mugilogobius chulae]
MMFRDQVSVLSGWFKRWNECEQTVALLSLLKRVTRTQARFLQLCLEHSLSDCSELVAAETDANDPAVISQWQSESKERAISLVLSHLPLLKPGNCEAKGEYMRLLPRILAQTIESGRHVEESRQLLSYALIHPATSLEDRSALALWLTHLEEHAGQREEEEELARGEGERGRQGEEHSERRDSLDRAPHIHSSRNGQKNQPFTQSQSSGVGQKNHLPRSAALPLKRSVSLTPPISSSHPPGQALGLGLVWLSQEDLRRGPDHAPLSPHAPPLSPHAPSPPRAACLVGQRGSEALEELNLSLTRGSFQQPGTGIGVSPLLTHEGRPAVAEESPSAQIRELDTDRDQCPETEGATEPPAQPGEGGAGGGGAPGPSAGAPSDDPNSHQAFQRHKPRPRSSPVSGGGASGGEAESGGSVVAEGDLPGQFTRVMGKVCTQLLVSRADEENLSLYLSLLDRCLLHEAFTDLQKKRLLSWKQQVQKLFRSIPRKTLLDLTAYRRSSRGLGQSNSLPSGSLGAGPSVRRSLRQYQMPSRSLPGARLGLLPSSSGALLGATARSSTPPGPAGPTGPLKGQGRQGLWFANPGGSHSVPSRTHSSVQRTRSLPVPPSLSLLQHQDFVSQSVLEPDINNRLESLCLSMTEHALG